MWRFLGWLVTLLTISVLGGVFFIFLAFYHYGKGLPDFEQLARYSPPVVSRLYANDGHLFAEYAAQKRVFVPITAIPTHIIRTFLSAEDKNFYAHGGLDFTGIVRAMWTNFINRGTQRRLVGGSTITQQVAKNFLLASNEVSFERKIKEAILAFRIEKAFSKEKILELYLNEIFFGNGSYGVAAAALNYFNKSLDELTVQEAAFLAGLPKAPSRYDPLRLPDLATSRRNWVIGRMREDGIISPKEEEQAKESPIVLRKRDPDHVVNADYFAEEVRRHLVQKYGEKALYEEGLTVKTTLSPRLQDIAQRSLCRGLEAYDRRHGWRGPVARLSAAECKRWPHALRRMTALAGGSPWVLAVVLGIAPHFAEIGLSQEKRGKISLENLRWARAALNKEGMVGPVVTKVSDVLKKGDVVLVSPEEKRLGYYKLEQFPEVNGAILVMDPYTGRVFALVGGYSFKRSQFDRATQAMRQAGSAFKPFVYLAALEKGLSPTTMIDDAPLSVPLGPRLGVYEPQNINKHFYGPTSLRVGLEKSRNVVTVRLALEYVGMREIARVAERFGVTKNLPLLPAMALGAGETTLFKLSTAYAMFVNGGKRITPTLIDVIHDRQGHILLRTDVRQCRKCQVPFKEQPHPPQIIDQREQISDPVCLYQLISMLEGVVRRGTAQGLKGLGRPIAGKTGSSNKFRDAWFIGLTPSLVVGAFVGFDDFRTLGDKETGSRVALPIVLNFMTEALAEMPSLPFRIPPGVKLVRVNAATGRLATPQDEDVIFEAFQKDALGTSAPLSPKNGGASLPLEALTSPVEHFFEEKNQEIPSPPPSSLTGTGGVY